jgi:hypothetical protein
LLAILVVSSADVKLQASDAAVHFLLAGWQNGFFGVFAGAWHGRATGSRQVTINGVTPSARPSELVTRLKRGGHG